MPGSENTCKRRKREQRKLKLVILLIDCVSLHQYLASFNTWLPLNLKAKYEKISYSTSSLWRWFLVSSTLPLRHKGRTEEKSLYWVPHWQLEDMVLKLLLRSKVSLTYILCVTKIQHLPPTKNTSSSCSYILMIQGVLLLCKTKCRIMDFRLYFWVTRPSDWLWTAGALVLVGGPGANSICWHAMHIYINRCAVQCVILLLTFLPSSPECNRLTALAWHTYYWLGLTQSRDHASRKRASFIQ